MVFQNLGLGIFVYLIGLAAGQTFFKDLRRQAGVMVAAIAVVAVAGASAVLVGMLMGLDRAISVGVFTGALTSTPAMALAQELSGTQQPAIGYSIGYLVGVILAIAAVALLVGRKWPARNDPAPASAEEITARTVLVHHDAVAGEVPGWSAGDIRISARRRGGETTVVTRYDHFIDGDIVEVVGSVPAIETAVAALGEICDQRLFHDRRDVEVRPFVLSNPDLAGTRIGDLRMYLRFGAIITRVRRGDETMLADDHLRLQLGDSVLVVIPRGREDAVRDYFGNSERSLTDIDWIALGVCIALGFAVALVRLPLPGGESFALGPAAGSLLVGMLLGAFGRTGPIVWQIPMATNLTLRQFGLMLFLAAVGIASGPAFTATIVTLDGLRAFGVAAVVAIVACGLMALAARLLGMSAARAVGSVAGMLGQPAVLDFATARNHDERINAGYAQIFAVALIAKLALVPFLL